MDQTPYNPRDVPSKTWDQRGAKTVTAKQMKVGVGHVSVLLTVCADGTKLPPLIVFKAKAGGRVEAEFTKPDFPKDGIYCAVQDNAWCDERIMLMWVDKVLKPYIATCPHGVIPYLLLDKYKCHSTAAVVREIEQLGVEWDILPGGCTGLIQPIDVGIGKPFKNRLCSKWEDWVVENFDIDDSTGEITETERIKPNSCRKLVAQWALESWNCISKEHVYNSWRHGTFSYFPGEPTVQCVFNEDPEECIDDDDDDTNSNDTDTEDSDGEQV